MNLFSCFIQSASERRKTNFDDPKPKIYNTKNFKNSKLSKCFSFVNLVRVNLFSTVFHPLINIKVLFRNVFTETAIFFDLIQSLANCLFLYIRFQRFSSMGFQQKTLMSWNPHVFFSVLCALKLITRTIYYNHLEKKWIYFVVLFKRRKTNFDDPKPKVYTKITRLIKMDQHLKELLTSLKKIIHIIILYKKSLRNLKKTENMEHVRHAEKKMKICLETRKPENQIDGNPKKN